MTTCPAALSTLLAATFFLASVAAAQPAPPAKAPAIDPANFDKAAKPCEDFYQFANGAWLAAHPIPADRSRYGGFDEHGNRFEREVEGFHARVVQHECDHLNGILYPMLIRDMHNFGFTEVLFPGVSDEDD